MNYDKIQFCFYKNNNMKKPKNHPKFGLGIDWETSGSDWDDPDGSHKKYQGLSFGVVIFDADTFEPIETLYRELKFDASKYKWSMEAQAIHGLSQEHLAEHGVEREEALADLLELILKYFGPEGKPIFLGHNADFDVKFTNQLLSDFGFDPLKKHHVILDTSSTGFITLGLYKSDMLFERLGFDKRNAHNALEDILMTLETCKIIKGLMTFAFNEWY